MRLKKILITVGAGFIGFNLYKKLIKDNLVYIINIIYWIIKWVRGRSVARCPGLYDRIIAVINNMKVRDQEERNKIFIIY